MKSKNVPNHERLRAVAGQRRQLAQFFLRVCSRLFEEHVFGGSQSDPGVLRMQKGWSCDGDRIDRRIAQKRIERPDGNAK